MSKAKIVLACLVWLVLLGIGAALYRLWYVPSVAKQEEQKQEEVLDATSGNSNYKHTLSLGLDAFSGYALLRSSSFRQELRNHQIRVEFQDDGADYEARLNALASGELDMAAFPIDALLKASAKLGQAPATIVAVIDETRGADAVVAYKSKFPDKQALLSPSTRFVAVGDSPSETLVRLLLSTFGRSLSEANLDLVDSEESLLRRYKQAKPAGDEVFVTWEPTVSQLLENQQMHVLYDSSQQAGVIVDTLVASRDFLIKNPAIVRDVLDAYFRARYAYGNDPQKLIQLVSEDAQQTGLPLTESQAKRLVDGIVWKNTQENLAHFGLRPASVTNIEDMIDRIKKILIQTGGLAQDPTEGKSNILFYQQVLGEMQAAGFHPGASSEAVREDLELKQLSESQWDSLVPVGTIDLPPLIYARGTARLTESSKLKLDELMETLKTFPTYYLVIRGNADSRGNQEANRKIAKQRADAALQYLLDNGAPRAKMRAVEGEIARSTSVTFDLAEMPY